KLISRTITKPWITKASFSNKTTEKPFYIKHSTLKLIPSTTINARDVKQERCS
ncbi:hypothetical protein HK096_001722, partial [Nowakowskiella sp. JEL0078]